MLFDINTAVGHWPFRQIPNNTLETLRAYLTGQNIGGAAVANTNAIFYMNPQDANRELADGLKYHGDFFTGIATLNPKYAAWERDLEVCVRQLGFRALRLVPTYHNYSLEEPEAKAIIAKAGQLGIPVILPNEIVNFRQKHWMEPPKPLGFQAAVSVANLFPNVNVIFTEGAVPQKGTYPKNLFFEMSRYRSAYGSWLTELINNVGADHVLFGTGAPFKCAEPSLLKLHNCSICDRDRSLIKHLNAKRLLAL